MSTISLEKFLFFGSVPAAIDTTRGWRFARASERGTAGLSSHPLRRWESRDCRFPAPPHKDPSPAETAPLLCEADAFQSFFTHTLPAFFHSFFRPWRNQGKRKAIRPTRSWRFTRASERDSAGLSSHPLRRWESRDCRFPAPPRKGPSQSLVSPRFFYPLFPRYFACPWRNQGSRKAAKNSPRQNRRLCLFCGSQ